MDVSNPESLWRSRWITGQPMPRTRWRRRWKYRFHSTVTILTLPQLQREKAQPFQEWRVYPQISEIIFATKTCGRLRSLQTALLLYPFCLHCSYFRGYEWKSLKIFFYTFTVLICAFHSSTVITKTNLSTLTIFKTRLSSYIRFLPVLMKVSRISEWMNESISSFKEESWDAQKIIIISFWESLDQLR